MTLCDICGTQEGVTSVRIGLEIKDDHGDRLVRHGDCPRYGQDLCLSCLETVKSKFSKSLQKTKIVEPQPAPVPRLIEAVESYIAMNERSAINGVFVLEEALAAEKKRNELVDELIRVAKTHYHKADNLDRAIQALDAFDKERGA